MTCKKLYACVRPNFHAGHCVDSNHRILPLLKPVVVLEVVERDAEGHPTKIREKKT